jgi:hypothetical protein
MDGEQYEVCDFDPYWPGWVRCWRPACGEYASIDPAFMRGRGRELADALLADVSHD